MPRGKATSAIARHLWNDHERTQSSGTLVERELLHEEIHSMGGNEINHTHGPNGEYTVICPCGHSHECTVLAAKEE